MMHMIYKNYRGETALRNIDPRAIEYEHNNKYHGPGFILHAHDFEKNAIRGFALRDCDFLSPQSPALARAILRHSLVAKVENPKQAFLNEVDTFIYTPGKFAQGESINMMISYLLQLKEQLDVA